MGSRFTEWGVNKPPLGWQVNPQAATDLNLTLGYLFNEGSGLFLNDITGNGNIGTLSGTTNWTDTGNFGTCLNIGATSGQIATKSNPFDAAANSWSTSFWQYSTASATGQQVGFYSSGFGFSTVGVFMASTTTVTVESFTGSGTHQFATYTTPLNQWFHITVTVNRATGLLAANISLYLNGVLQTPTSSQNGTSTVNGPTTALFVGSFNAGGFLGGLLDNFLLSGKTVWTPDQALRLYSDPFYLMQAPKRRLVKSSSVSTPLPFLFDSPSGAGPGAVSIAGLFSPPAVLQKPISPSQRFDPLPELDRSAWQSAVAAPPIPPVVNSPVGAPRSQRIDLEPQHWQWWQQTNPQSLQVVENMPDAPGDLLQLRVFLVNTDG